MTESDEILVARCQHGDQAAFEELVGRTSRLVYSRIYAEVGGDGHRAEDLTQETFLRAWRSIGGVIRPAGFRAWLLSVAHTVVIDDHRRSTRQRRSGRHESSEALGGVADQGADPSATAELDEQRQRVLSILRSLPEEYRSPLMLRYIAGADYETIGRQLGLTNGALRGLLSRGMAMLRTELRKADMVNAVT